MNIRQPLLIAYALAFAVLCVPVAGKLVWGVPPEDMLRDPAQVLDAPLYTGIISNLGLVLWGAAAGVCFLMSAVRHESRALWTWAGVISTMLLVDDGLMIHETVGEHATEYLLYALYAGAMLYYLLRFRAELLRAEPLWLIAAFAWFAASLGIDALDGVVDIPALWLWEDGAKLFGITSWLLFHADLAASFVAQRDRRVHAPRATGRQPRSQEAGQRDHRERRAPRPPIGDIQPEQ